MPKFRKRPIVIEAEQFFPNKMPWPAGVEQLRHEDGSVQHIVPTLEGPHIASPGDWIITGVRGEKYPCKADVFEATYEAVDE